MCEYGFLGSSGDQAAEAFESLIKALQDNDANVRRLAFVAIDQLLRRGMFGRQKSVSAD